MGKLWENDLTRKDVQQLDFGWWRVEYGVKSILDESGHRRRVLSDTISRVNASDDSSMTFGKRRTQEVQEPLLLCNASRQSDVVFRQQFVELLLLLDDVSRHVRSS